MAKSHCANYPLSFNKTTEPFTLIYPDVWGHAPISTLSGYRWFVIFVDDCSRMTWLYLMTNKNDVYECFCSFHKMVQTQFSAKVKVLKSDNGGEFVSQVLQSYFQDHGIVHETTCPYTPQQNGVAERKNWHILEITLVCLIDAHMPSTSWGDAILYVVYLMNRVPSSVLQFKTPLEKLSTYVNIPSNLTLVSRPKPGP